MEMESPAASPDRKRRGFMKFHRAGKISSSSSSTTTKASSHVKYSSNVYRPSQTSPSTGYLDYVIAPPKQQTVSFVNTNPENTKQFEAFFGVYTDEGVDIKATSYIINVQERFKLEGTNHA